METAVEDGKVLPTTESHEAPDAATNGRPSVTEEQWRAMKSILESLLTYRDEEDHDPTRIFHKRVNRRNVPDYYEVIKEPMAFSNLKQKTADREYQTFADFVRDNALIWHNAHTYNRPDAGAYQDASTLKELMEAEFKKLVEQKTISPEDAQWPDLGEIPPVEDIPDEEDEDGEEDDDEEDDEADDSDEEMHKPRRGPGRPPRRDTMFSESGRPDSNKKKRGRPPKVDTPMEARIKNVLKGLRKPKTDDGLMIFSFEKLPEKTVMPEYYATILHPMSIDQIKKSLKRKRYRSVDDFMRDVDLMFENAKLYNEDDSQIHQDAAHLQKEAHRLAEIEKKRADTDFVMEEGRKPRPDGITHNGKLWKVGDWVHITNANDTAKPIIAQIYRTWEDGDGQEWVNACWYYRPEQTVHHFEKHFYPLEVVKTGQYRDHPIDDVIERCYVMFFTRFPKGRPRGLAPEAKVYVCEARYNEEKHKINKIKTWASCLPDEIRDQDYEMDLFPDGPRRNKKVPSPLLYMLEQGDVSEKVPQLKWGEENAPPILGGLYKGPREENQTPPPQRTPSPPPQPTVSQRPHATTEDSWGKADEHFKKVGETFAEAPANRLNDTPQASYSTPHPPQYRHLNVAPASAGYMSNAAATPQQVPNLTPQTQPVRQSAASYLDQYTPHRAYGNQSAPPAQRYAPMPTIPPGGRQADAFILNDHQNAQIPPEVREQFHQTDTGHVLFFNRPPVVTLPPKRAAELGGHTIAYRAAKIRRRLLADAERNEEMEVDHDHENVVDSTAPKSTTAGADATGVQEVGSNAAAHALSPPSDTRSADIVPFPTPPMFRSQEALGEWLRDYNKSTLGILRAMRPSTSDDELWNLNQERTYWALMEGQRKRDQIDHSQRERLDLADTMERALRVDGPYKDDIDPRLFPRS